MIPRRAFLACAVAALLATPDAARAQQVTKIPRVGVLRLGPLPPSASESFRQGLRDLGYVEGQSIVLPGVRIERGAGAPASRPAQRMVTHGPAPREGRSIVRLVSIRRAIRCGRWPRAIQHPVAGSSARGK